MSFARNMSRYAWLRILCAVLGALVGFALVLEKHHSESALWHLISILVLLVPLAILFLVLDGKWKVLIHFILLPALVVFLAFQGFHSLYWPSTIRFSFETPPGASGSYHAVQFEHRVDDQWIEGPRVKGWPLRVVLRDINSDGYNDIRVTEANKSRGQAIEFVYIPNTKDGIYWQAHRMDSRLSAAYNPAGIFHNYP